MKRQAHSSQGFSKNHSNQQQIPSLIEPLPKLEKIPTTFVFDKRIPSSEYKNYISIDDIYNENFEYARKLFEDPSRAFVVADTSGDHKVPRRLAQVNQKLMKDEDNLQKLISPRLTSQIPPTKGNTQSQLPTEIVHGEINKKLSQTKKEEQSFSQQDKQVELNHQTSKRVKSDLPPFSQQESTAIHFGSPSPDINLQSQTAGFPITQANNLGATQTSFGQTQKLYSSNTFGQNQNKTQEKPLTAAAKSQGRFLDKRSVRTSEKKERSEQDKIVQGIIVSTREKVKRLQSYAEKLKRKVMQNDFGHNYKRNQMTIKKSQLVKNFIFNEEDFGKMLIQEEEDDKKNMAGKKERTTKGFVERQDAQRDEKKKIPYTYQSLTLEQNQKNRLEAKKKADNSREDDEEDESDHSREVRLNTSGDKIKDHKLSKHNFNKKMKLKKRSFENETIFKEAEETYSKILEKLGGFQKHWNHIGILPKKDNNMRLQSLQCSRQCKIIKLMNEKYGDLDLLQAAETSSKKQIKNEDDLLNHLQALLTKPDASGDFKIHKSVNVHKNRIKNMRQKDVGIINISNLSIEA